MDNGKLGQGTVTRPWSEMGLEELRQAYRELQDSRAEVIRQKDAVFDELQKYKQIVAALTTGGESDST